MTCFTPQIADVLSEDFYGRDTVTIARELLGKVLIHRKEGLTSGRIVEVEAYLGKDDPSSHASRRRTLRNSVMFGPPGRAYVYFIYGNHYLLNAVTEVEGKAGAVLIRALEPLEGIGLMRRRRGQESLKLLTSGPGRLTQALGIGIRENRTSLMGDKLFIMKESNASFEIASSPRIGVGSGDERTLRFYIAGNDFVSTKPSPIA